MKSLILSVVAIAGVTAGADAQIFFADNSHAAYDTTINGAPNYSEDLNLQLLFGGAPDSFSTTPVVTLLLSCPIITSAGDQIGQTYSAGGDISDFGTIFDNTGQEYYLGGAPSYEGQTAYFQVLAWTGSYASYLDAKESGSASIYVGASAIFTEAIPPAMSYPGASISNVGVINLVPAGSLAIPEPTPLAMAGVGIASLLVFGCRKIIGFI